MVQIVKERMKDITEKQIAAIKQIIQNKGFNLSDYKKLKRILESRVITRQDASVFLEYCYAKVHFERYFNGHKHKSYASCFQCKGRDNLRKIENIKTGEKKWCCQTCRIDITDPDIIDLPAAQGNTGGAQKRNELTRIRGLATDIVLMADDSSGSVVPDAVSRKGQQACFDSGEAAFKWELTKEEFIQAIRDNHPEIINPEKFFREHEDQIIHYFANGFDALVGECGATYGTVINDAIDEVIK